jgi:derlin-1
MGSVVLPEPLLMCIVYMWSMCNMDETVSFMFGLRFKALYLPWVLVALDVVMGGPLSMDKLVGIAVGHVLYFMERVFPASEGGFRLLPTPGLLLAAFPPDTQDPGGLDGPPTTAGFRVRPAGRAGEEAAGARPRRAWGGAGRRLGD